MNLQASVLQLKNALYRQRRIRALNERTATSMNELYQRAEDLVSEMRSEEVRNNPVLSDVTWSADWRDFVQEKMRCLGFVTLLAPESQGLLD